jgi:Lrp/AsnC family transcriptional regulator
VDRTERSILALIQADAALSIGEVADRVGISKSACWRRIQKLEEEGVIQGRVTLLNAAALDLPLTVFITIKTNQHNEKWARNFKAVVADIPGILEVHRMGGEIDYLIKAVVRDMPGYDKLYQQLIRADLFDVTSSFVMEEIKRTTALPL